MSAWQTLPPLGDGPLTEDPVVDDPSWGVAARDEAADLAEYRRARHRARTRRLATGALGLFGLAVVWQIAAMLAHSVFLPSVTQTVQTLFITSTGHTRARARRFGSTQPGAGGGSSLDSLSASPSESCLAGRWRPAGSSGT